MPEVKKQTNIPNAEQQKQFHKYIEFWQETLNLMDWRIERVNKVARGAMAAIEFNDAARLVTYRLGDFGSATINASSLSSTALHECLHVFIHDLVVAAQNKASLEELEAAEHRVVNTLEKLLMLQESDDAERKM